MQQEYNDSPFISNQWNFQAITPFSVTTKFQDDCLVRNYKNIHIRKSRCIKRAFLQGLSRTNTEMIQKRLCFWKCTLAGPSILSSLFIHTSLIQKFIRKFCEFITNILPGGICQHISECWTATRSVSPFGIRNALSQTPQKSPVKLRNLFNMQLMFFHFIFKWITLVKQT